MTSTCILLAFYDQNWNLSTRKTIQYLPLCIHRIQNKATSAVWHPWLLGWGLSPVVLGKGLVLCPPESWIWVSQSPSLNLFTQFPSHLSPADWSTSGIPTKTPSQHRYSCPVLLSTGKVTDRPLIVSWVQQFRVQDNIPPVFLAIAQVVLVVCLLLTGFLAQTLSETFYCDCPGA